MLFRLVPVVRRAAKLQVLECRRTTGSVRHDVVYFEETGLPATTSRSFKLATAFIPCPNLPPNGRRDMTREILCRPRCPRVPGRSESLFVERVEKYSQCAIKNSSGIAVGHAMAEQVLSPSELLVGFGGDCELHFVSPRGEWLDLLGPWREHWNPIDWRFGRLGIRPTS